MIFPVSNGMFRARSSSSRAAHVDAATTHLALELRIT
jgi:hypothetical protein